MAKVLSINFSEMKKVTKKTIGEAKLVENFGLEGDAHAGPGLRQVSLLGVESIARQQERSRENKSEIKLRPGIFAENITTEGFDHSQLKIGDRLLIGQEAMLEISQIGKECHQRCAVYYAAGDCIMPREGIFAKVIHGGLIRQDDSIELINCFVEAEKDLKYEKNIYCCRAVVMGNQFGLGNSHGSQ